MSHRKDPPYQSPLLQVKDVDSCRDVPIVMVANKCDIHPGSRMVERKEAQEKAALFGSPYVETSAKEGFGVQECFEQAVREHRRMARITEAKQGKRVVGRSSKPCVVL